MSEPTPTPWFVEDSKVAPTGRKISNADRAIATVWGGMASTGADDAALIVRAVNSHDDLVNALGALVEIAGRYPTTDYEGHPMEDDQEVNLDCMGFFLGSISVGDINRAIAALSKAKATP